ncbi:hypothetical protein HOY80DRAFT_993705 [Tuber brumale]|nr:hypothetical protein HOY80DRAFT_993705 [Tuber brumale]
MGCMTALFVSLFSQILSYPGIPPFFLPNYLSLSPYHSLTHSPTHLSPHATPPSPFEKNNLKKRSTQEWFGMKYKKRRGVIFAFLR